jgi:16S rRNA (adenine1518-N6/adenine1519-N6)-dimethyltransferase
LTREIAKDGADVLAVEKDKRFCGYLRERFAASPNVRIREGDILEFPFAEYLSSGPAKITGNLPYQISSPILEAIQPYGARWTDALFTFQKDFARRMIAAESAPDRSPLGVWLGLHAKVEIVADFRRGDFLPPPLVDSSLVRLRFFEKPLFDPAAGPILRAAIRSSFQERRKNLLNGLSKGTQLSKCDLTEALAEARIAPNRRPESLSLEDWIRLGSALCRRRMK